MGSKYPSIMEDTGKNPGPGDYETNTTVTSTLLAAKRSKFGTASRFSQPNLHVPGPGDYELMNKKGMVTDKGTIGKGERMVNKKNLPPGPTQYSQRSAFEYNPKYQTGKTFGKKF